MSARHRIRLVTEDGSLEFDCDAEQSLVEGAAAAGIALPAVCRQGNCGACRGRALDGRYQLGAHAPAALSPADERRGEVLLCRTFAREDASFGIDAPLARLTAGAAREYTAEVLAIDDLGGNVRRLRVRAAAATDGALASSFEPGQFMELSPPGTELRRPYSLSNVPNWEGELEFLVRLQPGGAFSSWLREQAALGGSLGVRGPQGSLALREGSLAPRYFVAGGTGIAPLLSMLRQMAELREPNECRLYFGVNTREELFAEAEIERLRSALPSLEATVCVAHPRPGEAACAGSPAEALRAQLERDRCALRVPDVYVCGPAGLVSRVEQIMDEAGLGRSRLFAERFLPTTPVPAAADER